jgi:hypothetical protein
VLGAVTKESEKDLIRSLLDKFPESAQDARGVKETEWRDKLFCPHTDAGTVYVPVPNNIADFSDNLLFISILKAIEAKRWKIIISTQTLAANVLKTEKGMYFAGYVAMSLQDYAGTRIKPSNLFEKGQVARQTEAVLAHVGRQNAHIRRTPHSIGKVLADMSGFSRQYWGLRSTISAIFKDPPLFKDLPLPEVDYVASFMLSGGELVGKIIRRTLPYQNGGVFRKEELQYLDRYYSTEKRSMEKIHKECQDPSEDFAKDFYGHVDTLTDICKRIERDLGTLFAQRAQVLFRSGSRKKSDIKWAQKSIDEKLLGISEENYTRLFCPTNLPGFVKATRTTNDKVTIEEYVYEKYSLKDDTLDYEVKLAVCTSYETLLAVRREE